MGYHRGVVGTGARSRVGNPRAGFFCLAVALQDRVYPARPASTSERHCKKLRALVKVYPFKFAIAKRNARQSTKTSGNLERRSPGGPQQRKENVIQ